MTLAIGDGESHAGAGSDPSPAPRRQPELLIRLYRAIGITGIVWSIAATLLGAGSLAVTLIHVHITREMVEIRDARAIAGEIIGASSNLDNTVIAVLATGAGDGSFAQFRPPLFEWVDAAQRLRHVCGRTGALSEDFALRLGRICTTFAALDLRLMPALTAQDRLGVRLDHELVVALVELARLTGEAAQAMRQDEQAGYGALRDAQARSARIMISGAAAVLLAVLILFSVVTRAAAGHHKASQRALRAHAAAQKSRRQLLDAIEALPVGFALYDRDERLVLYNRVLAEMATGWLDPSDIGRTYEDLRNKVRDGLREREAGSEHAARHEENVARFRRGNETADIAWSNGRIVRVNEVRTHDGGTVAIRTDITELKQREEEARASERRFQMLVNSLTDVVFSLNRESRFTYASASAVDMLGFEPDELLGRPVLELIHPEDHLLLYDVATQLRAHRGLPATLTCRLRKKAGGWLLTEIRLTAPEKHDNLEGEMAMTGLARDVEAQHEMARRLRDRMERLNSIVQSTGALFLLIDRDLRIVMANNGFLDFAGVEEERIVGRLLKDVVDCPLDAAIVEAWLAADATQVLEPVEFDNTLPDRHGGRRTIRVTANPVRGDSGRVEHIVFLGVDETVRRHTELQLFDASRLATLGEMASGIAHEINQPLTVIRFAAESLQEELETTPDDAMLGNSRRFIDEKCARMVAQTERAATIIRDLRGFARRPDDTPARFDVALALRVAVKMVAEQFRLAHVEIDREIDPDCPSVLGHPSRLQQVVLNLLLNARDAILGDGPRGSGRIMLRLRAAPDPGKVVITVEDDGAGIAGHALPRVFEPFFTTKPTGKGTGLGLSISYQIIHQMGGNITAENRPEGGARFTITLDAAPVQEAAAAD